MRFFIAFAKKPPLSVHIEVSCPARGLDFGLCLNPYIVYANRKALASVHISSADCPEPLLLDKAIKYQNLIHVCWLKCRFDFGICVWIKNALFLLIRCLKP